MNGPPLVTVLAALALGLGATAAPAAAGAAVSPGVVTQGPLAENDFALMDQGGVETVRFQVTWRTVETAPGRYDWSELDRLMDGFGRHGLEPLPYIFGSPAWVATDQRHAPIDDAAGRQAWQRFLAAMAARYGPGGGFWQGRAGKSPIRRWQIWNEPNFEFYWDGPPDPRAYAELVKISAQAIRAQHRRAKVVLGGVAPVRSGTRWWIYLRKFYDVPGVKRHFDAVALHPYSQTMGDLRWQVKRARKIMENGGDAQAPLAITEIGWSSATDRVPLVVGPEGQARLLRKSFRLFADRKLRISDADWFAWQDTTTPEPHCSFCAGAGLFDLQGNPKPSWDAYRKAARRF